MSNHHGTYLWYEIQDAVDYHKEFEKNKIVWAETSLGNQLCMVDKGIYLNKTTFMIPVSDKYLLGLMNSKLVHFYLDNIVSKVRGGYFSMSKSYVQTTPIAGESKEVEQKVEEILSIKSRNPQADTSNLESQIDQLVYQLYDLSAEEIAIIEDQ